MSSKTDAFLKLGLFFFVALLSFSVGTFIGKKWSDNQHQLAALEPQKNSHGDSHSREVASVSAGHGEQKAGAMTDEEIAKLAEEFVADDTVPANVAEAHGDAHAAPAHGAPAGHGETAKAPTAEAAHGGHDAKPETAKDAHHKASPITSNNEVSDAAKNVAQGKAPTTTTAEHGTATTKAAPVKERVPSSLPKDVAQYAVGKFTVQVAAYPVEAEAQKMASDLKNKGYSAFYVPATVKGTTYYRVSVGQFATQKEATTYRGEFLAKSKLSSAIVQKISE